MTSLLPPEIWSQIFDFLPLEDVKICREVSRGWCGVASACLGARSQLEIDSSDQGALETYRQGEFVFEHAPIEISLFKSNVPK